MNKKSVQTPATVVPTGAMQVAGLSDFEKEMLGDAGVGVSTRPSDNIIPSIKILQPLSPEIVNGTVEGAKPGDIMLSTSNSTIKGDAGIYFQPCQETQWWFEFVPREAGGGFVDRYPVEYDPKSPDKMLLPVGVEEEQRFRYRFTKSGNNCTHYRFVAGLLWREKIGLEFVIPFTGTGHTIARDWNTKRGQKRLGNGSIRPAFGAVYLLKTMQRKNKMGTWYTFDIHEGIDIEKAETIVGDFMPAYHRGKMLAEAIMGNKREVRPERDEELPFDSNVM